MGLPSRGSASPLQLSRFMRFQNLDIGDTARMNPYAPEPIEHEVTEVIERLEPILDADGEPPPLPPIPARGSRMYPVVTLYPRFR